MQLARRQSEEHVMKLHLHQEGEAKKIPKDFFQNAKQMAFEHTIAKKAESGARHAFTTVYFVSQFGIDALIHKAQQVYVCMYVCLFVYT